MDTLAGNLAGNPVAVTWAAGMLDVFGAFGSAKHDLRHRTLAAGWYEWKQILSSWTP